MRRLTLLPDGVRHPLSLLGMAIATAMAIVFLLLVLLELAGFLTNPYIGLLVFVAIPSRGSGRSSTCVSPTSGPCSPPSSR